MDPLEASPLCQIDTQAWAALMALDKDGKMGLHDKLVQAYANSLERQLPLLRQACLTQDAQALREVVHSFKSSLASIGAIALSRHCAGIETQCQKGQALDFSHLGLSLERDFSQILDQIRRLSAEPAG